MQKVEVKECVVKSTQLLRKCSINKRVFSEDTVDEVGQYNAMHQNVHVGRATTLFNLITLA